MKRIICTVTNDLSFDQRMIRICTSLANAGYDVLLVGRKLKTSIPLINQAFRQKRFRLFFNKGKLFYLEYNLRLFFFLFFVKYDIVCSVDLDTLLPGYIVSKIKNKKTVYDAHEYFTEVPEVIERPMVKKIWEAVAAYIVPKVDAAYTVCESLADIFYEKYKTRFAVIRNVPFRNKIDFKLKKNDAPFILIYQGVLNEGRGLEELIGAMEKSKGVICWLAGEGDISNKLRNMVAKKGLQKKVLFLGRISPGKLKKITPQAHLGINLLKNKSLNYYYSLANKTFDYMQAGIPSICMDFPEYKKINKRWGAFFLLKKLDAETIAGALVFLKNNKEKYGEMKSNSIKAAEHFVWEKEEGKLLETFTKLDIY
ncbi:MAG TPA: glycosyltransferase [Bacteroidetes bacterium]|nr:glycosyltransferase [Bacteroidota bacterium]